ncbi:MAG: HD domain-containing protein, partial [ANME-2 cluster archaeon]
MKNNAPEHMVIAGLLYDVVEDEEVTLSDIIDKFDDKVATLVYGAYEPEELINAELSKSKTWPERKAHTIDVIKNADRDLKLLSCADKLANIRDIIRDYDRLGGWCVGYLQCLKGLGCMVLH